MYGTDWWESAVSETLLTNKSQNPCTLDSNTKPHISRTDQRRQGTNNLFLDERIPLAFMRNPGRETKNNSSDYLWLPRARFLRFVCEVKRIMNQQVESSRAYIACRGRVSRVTNPTAAYRHLIVCRFHAACSLHNEWECPGTLQKAAVDTQRTHWPGIFETFDPSWHSRLHI